MFAPAVFAVTKPHVIVFGKWISVQALDPGSDEKPTAIKIRPLIVDGRTREFAMGAPHEVTDRLFVVRRAFRVNDSLPEDPAPRWQWQTGGWLLVDRMTGRVSALNLPDFDAEYSAVSWYRDYVAYCGTSDDGKKSYVIVSELARKKPILKKALSDAESDDNGSCPAPVWQRAPARVTFEMAAGRKQTFEVHGHVADVVNDADEEDEGTK
jgi:hypothetical protein